MEQSKERKQIITRSLICALGLIVLVIILVIKPSVNNAVIEFTTRSGELKEIHITNIYYMLTVLFAFITVYNAVRVINQNLFESNIGKIAYEVSDFATLFIVICCIFQALFVFGFFKANVDQNSMNPTLSDGNVLIVRSTSKVKNFDIVVVEYDSEINTGSYENDKLLVKRLIAKGGDTFYFDEGVLYLNNERIEENYINSHLAEDNQVDLRKFVGHGMVYDEATDSYYVEEGYYFVMGDNRRHSYDSRYFGLFKKSQIVGVVYYRVNSLFDWEDVRLVK